MRGMRNAYYARDNFDVRRGGRGFSCAVKNTLISQKDAVDTRTFRVKPNTPKLLSMPGKNGGQLWDLPSISMGKAQNSHGITGKCRQPSAAQYKFYTLACFSLLLNEDITISYQNTQTSTVYV